MYKVQAGTLVLTYATPLGVFLAADSLNERCGTTFYRHKTVNIGQFAACAVFGGGELTDTETQYPVWTAMDEVARCKIQPHKGAFNLETRVEEAFGKFGHQLRMALKGDEPSPEDKLRDLSNPFTSLVMVELIGIPKPDSAVIYQVDYYVSLDSEGGQFELSKVVPTLHLEYGFTGFWKSWFGVTECCSGDCLPQDEPLELIVSAVRREFSRAKKSVLPNALTRSVDRQ